MSTCKDCKHWNGDPDSSLLHPTRYRQCDHDMLRLDECESPSDGACGMQRSSGDWSDCPCVVWTGPDFGCVHFESGE